MGLWQLGRSGVECRWVIGCSALFLILLPYLSNALDPEKAITQYVHRTWHEETGLPHSAVQDIAQSREGYLWLATLGGLVRFDGDHFEVFNSHNRRILGSDRVLAVCAATDGSVWAVGEGSPLVRIAGPQITQVDTIGAVSYALEQTRDGCFWVGTYGHGIARFKGRHLIARYTARDGLPNDFVLALYEDPNGSMWIGTDGGGIAQFRNGTFTVWNRHSGLSSDYIYAICGDGAGGVWVGTYGGGLVHFKEGAVRIYREKDGLPSDFIVALRLDSSGSLWIGTYGGGLARLLRQGRISSYGKNQGLSNDMVMSIFEDRDGAIWVGTREGLDRFSDGPFTTYGTAEALVDDTVLTVFESREGDLYVGTRRGLNRIRNGAVQTYTTRQGLRSNTVTSLCQDATGDLWIGTSGGGVSRMRNGSILRSYTILDGLPDDIVWVLHADQDNNLWIGGPSGLAFLQGSRFTTLTTKDGLASDRVLAVLKDRGGTLWIGTDGGGMNRMQNGKIFSYSEKDGLASNIVTTFHEDADGTLWIGTWGGGLNRLRDDRFVSLTPEVGFPSDIVHQIVASDDRFLWIRGNKSIVRVSKDEIEQFATGRTRHIAYQVFGRQDGMRSAESDDAAAQPAGCRTRDGKLWWASIGGLVSVDPTAIRERRPERRVYVEGVMADHAAIVANRQELVEIPAGTNRIDVRYTAIDFATPQTVRFRVKLEGFDKDWIDVGTERSIAYTRLAPGRYTLRVAATALSGAWSHDYDAHVNLLVAAPFYRTRWFHSSCILALLAAPFGLYLWRAHRVTAHQRKLAAQVQAALQHVKVLRGLLPICSSCKKIRDDTGYWNQVEVYVRDHTEAEFTHSICPDCLEKLYPGYSATARRQASTPGSASHWQAKE